MADLSLPQRHAEQERAARALRAYLDRIAREAWVVAVHHDPVGDPWAWYLRLTGDERDFVAIWFRVRERTLLYESYLMPPPEENAEALYLYLLKVNQGLVGVKYGIGGDDELGVFLTGHLPVEHVDEDALDAVVGTCWETIERHSPRRWASATHPCTVPGVVAVRSTLCPHPATARKPTMGHLERASPGRHPHMGTTPVNTLCIPAVASPNVSLRHLDPRPLRRYSGRAEPGGADSVGRGSLSGPRRRAHARPFWRVRGARR